MRFTLFRTPRPRQFKHVPIYYDESKEQLEEMKRNAEYEAGSKKSGEYRPNIKGQFSKKRISENVTFGQDEQRKSTIRLVVIIVFLLFVAYLILNMNIDIFRIIGGK